MKGLSHLPEQTWALLLAGTVQLQWHQAHWKDATPEWCKQGRSWHIRKHSGRSSQTYRMCNALLKLIKDLWMSETKAHGENIPRQLLRNARRYIHISYKSNACASCSAGSKHRHLTGELGHRGHEYNFTAPAGFQPWLQPFGSLANVTHRNLASTCTAAQHKGPGRPALLWMSGWS